METPGGLGLPLVAQLSGAHGWTIEGGRKVVRARIDFARADALRSTGPRGEVGGDRETGGSASR